LTPRIGGVIYESGEGSASGEKAVMPLNESDTRAKLIDPAFFTPATGVKNSSTARIVPERWRLLTVGYPRVGGLENPKAILTPEILEAGVLNSLKELGKAVEVLRKTKPRIFAA
jgi:hypothetical protein